MATPEKTYDRLVERAGAQHGFVRTKDLDELAIPQVYIRKLAASGRAENRARGLYRLTAIPVTANDEYHEAVLWAGNDAAVSGEAALALWDLADVNPRHIEVAVPHGHRPRRDPKGRFKALTARLAPNDIDFVDQIPVVVAGVAIGQAIERGLEGSLIGQAITTAATRGLLGQLPEARLRVALADRNQRAHQVTKTR
ncbi:MAG: type IV toxin-antitoxin system AbiEi family antitoxin domain-containing protein [Actinomycetota bacterium]|nr:type IV toxin-antitoxin system AbiEi family antitoxin domain-containing protein [Actinomycetota bacterium]